MAILLETNKSRPRQQQVPCNGVYGFVSLPQKIVSFPYGIGLQGVSFDPLDVPWWPFTSLTLASFPVVEKKHLKLPNLDPEV